jgi:predicted DsbA family dithiol-disulfide isomerase
MPVAARHLLDMRALKIDVFSDVVCPWCLIGTARLDQAIAALPEGVTVDIENHPFYLDPETPPEGYDVGEMLREKYGREPETIWGRAESEARASGIALDLSLQPRTFPTQKAHTLIRLARQKGTQHALANAIASAYFLAHRPVNEDAVLAEIATGFGFARDEAMTAVNDPREVAITHNLAVNAARQGLRGVPFYVFDAHFALSGCQPEATFALALEKLMEGEGAA